MRALYSFPMVLLVAGLATGCLSEQRFVAPGSGGLWMMAVDETTPPFLES